MYRDMHFKRVQIPKKAGIIKNSIEIFIEAITFKCRKILSPDIEIQAEFFINQEPPPVNKKENKNNGKAKDCP